MRLLALLFIAFFLSQVGQGLASSKCYTIDEAEAEQGIRIHSELMVIGLNCQHKSYVYSNRNLYTQYREFTSKHVGLFAGYEEKLISFFRENGDSDPEARLNTMRTKFANKISNDSARMRPDVFCQRYAPRITKVAHMNREDLRKWATTFFPSHPVSRPLCK